MFKRTFGLAIVAGLPVTALAGPLDPPAGPVSSTFKTLNEVEPRTAINATNTPGDGISLYRILSPGSYYLTGNITGTSGKRGISVFANGVTIDLNGFTMDGAGVGDDAIFAGSGANNLTVKNGTTRNWVKEGVDGYNASNCIVEGMRVENHVNGFGIITGPNSVITRCTVRAAGAGIVTTPGCTVRDCTATANGSGFALSLGNTVSGCTAQDSTNGPGFATSTGCSLTACASRNNLGAGGYGFDLGSGNTVSACSASENDQDGFHVQAGQSNVLISGCTAHTNRGHGIKTENGVGYTISGNNCSRNNGNGIQVGGGSSVLNNTCENNGTLVGASTSGIYVTFSYNRIDGNSVLGSTYGIAVASGMTNNIIIRNTATLCITPYSLPAGTTYGAINFLPSGSFTDTNAFANLKF